MTPFTKDLLFLAFVLALGLAALWCAWRALGLPMRRGKFRFENYITGKPVHEYRCRNNKLWLAESRWSFLLRVALTEFNNEVKRARLECDQ